MVKHIIQAKSSKQRQWHGLQCQIIRRAADLTIFTFVRPVELLCWLDPFVRIWQFKPLFFHRRPLRCQNNVGANKTEAHEANTPSPGLCGGVSPTQEYTSLICYLQHNLLWSRLGVWRYKPEVASPATDPAP